MQSITFSETPAAPENPDARVDPYEIIRAAKCPECRGPGTMVGKHRLTAIDHGSFCVHRERALANRQLHVQ